MKIVGITGRSGSGKSSAAAFFRQHGYPVVDGDVVAREITEKGSACLIELVSAFGNDILQEDGTLQRKKLASKAFSNPQSNAKLIQITHPYITARFLQQAEEAKQRNEKIFFVDAAMIVGEEFEKYCDALIVVTAPLTLSISRIVLRDGISKQAAIQRLQAQKNEQELLKAADYVVVNDRSVESLYKKLETVENSLLE